MKTNIDLKGIIQAIICCFSLTCAYLLIQNNQPHWGWFIAIAIIVLL